MTIEERASELGAKYARQYHHNDCFLKHDESFVYSNREITDACVEMATDQQKIDIEKACDLYRKELEQAELIIKNINPKGLGLIDIDKSVDKFRQAMEEQK